MKTRTAGSLNLRTSKLAIAVSLAVCAIATGPGTAHAQSAPPAPVRESVDANGVDLFSGKLTVTGPALTLGGRDNGTAYRQWNKGAGWSDNLTVFLNLSGSTMTVSLGSDSDSFSVSGTTYTSLQGNGSTLTYNSTSNVYTYTSGDGTVVHFLGTRLNEYVPFSNKGMVTDIVSPNGDKLTFNYEDITYCVPNTAHTACARQTKAYRVASVVSSYGYKLVPQRTSYEWMGDPDNPNDQPDFSQWAAITGVNGLNLASSTSTVLASESFATTVSGGVTTHAITDPAGQETKYRLGSAGEVLGITLPGDTSEFETVTYSSGRVSSVTKGGVATGYSSSDSGNDRTVLVTDPASQVWTYLFDIPSARLKSLTDPQSHVTSYDHDTSGRLTKTTYPEHNYVQLTYDGRGNVTETRAVDKTGTSSSSDIVTTAWYEDCSTAATCNQPTRIHSARGNPTDTDDHTYETVYAYDSDGTLHTVTEPADADGVHPVTTYGYTDLQAYYDTGSGIVASGQHVQRLTSITRCRTGSSCTGTANEQVQTIDYGPQTTGTGNNLNPVSATVKAGDNSISATTALAYDAIGNVTAVDGPLSGTADKTIASYDALRRPEWQIAPDPDDGGSALYPAVKYNYRPDGQMDYVQYGTVTAQSAGAWSSFAQSNLLSYGYDSHSRRNREIFWAGSTVAQVTDYFFDGAGRVLCSMQKMDAANFGGAISSCTPYQTTGADGPDRVTLNHYDTLGRVDKVTTGYGTSAAADDITRTFTDNGQLHNVADGEGHLTTYEYDAHDRLWKTFYPNLTVTTPRSSSTSDYQQLGYDADGHVTSLRTRAAETLSFSYDNLGRLTLKDVPSRTGDWCGLGNATLCATHTRDVYYGYDLLGEMTFARFDGAASTNEGITFAYDVLGRELSETQSLNSTTRQLGFGYDAAGNRTSVTWPDSNYVYFGRYGAGGLYYASLNGTSPLYYTPLDAAGRSAGIYRYSPTAGNWWVIGSGLSYDGASRLSGFGQYFPASTYNVSTNFHYNAAGQIVWRETGNDLYNYTRAATPSGGIAATADELNRLTAVGSASLSYDNNRNLTSDGTSSYVYDPENRLVAKTGGTAANLRYDPLGRLYEFASGSTTTRFLYDGSQLAAEYHGATGALLRRYVPGPDADQPLAMFDGSGVTDSERRYLYADERGSVVATSNADGTSVSVNTYDEYGRPGSSNTGRFQYTGQAWMPELGLYYYKARLYDPKLGRFLQTDPIGYGDGMNVYRYVHNDPVNWIDPWGFKPVWVCDASGVCRYVDDKTGKPTDPPEGPPVFAIAERPGHLRQGDVRVVDLNNEAQISSPVNGEASQSAYDPKVNYCGGSGGVSLPNHTPGASYNEACFAHDQCYNKSGTPKSVCDREFAFAIQNLIEKRSPRTIGYRDGQMTNQDTAAATGFIGWLLVHFFGGKFYVPK